MRGTAKGKVVTSGRLTGGGRVQLSRRRTPSNPGAAVRTEPAYSLYSTDSEDQVTTLHRGLDRCAALLGGMLQAEKAEPLPGLPKRVKLGAAKSRPSTSLRKNTIGNTEQRGPAAAAVLPQKLRPPQKQAPTLQLRPPTPPAQPQTSTPPPQPQPSVPPPQTSIPPPQPPTPPPPPQTSVPPPQSEPQAVSEAPPTSCLSDCDVEEEECVPVRDTDTHTAVRQTHTCSVVMPNTQMETGHVAMVTEDTRVGERKMVQNLLEELKALITGQGSAAERLLSHLEQSLSSQLMDVGGPVQTAVDLSSVQNQNCQLRRRVRILNQQLKEREKAALHSMEPLNNSAVCSLQEQLDGAQSRLQELQEELTGVRKDLRDTQSQLRDKEDENTLLTADLEATRSRLRDSEREKTVYSSLAQQRLEERENCNRVLQSLESTKACFLPQQQRQQPPPERITHFLLSLGQPVSAEIGDTPLRDTSSHPDVTLTDQSLCPHEVQAGGWGLLSHADGSVCSDLSSRSGSTLDSRAEAAFRDGLAALDASIASLQRTFQLDLGGAR
ncbi:coiled-coil domain-containing protein 14-like [Pseudochaenichthys georgianus]|uniref:coiled-coil domain-containing protein 14-like n=1 Tax=Pseudochaenichthys georgianus TaxID=52239 RepID=UPI001469B8B9|nr:coiled-coil domain-containing protein 14 [Pseudochaenichthys georgianus]